ncbi:hypothetical protein [Undibacterium parvum]|uniref:Uncharacterized protein n=1 Tax=Undibacterium parvum TaxID=401471 RepID=A0A3S9HJ71_9BURK|nr:hypothetical protein [Undibacterium parvum]AZP12165.1 hypothetical protein EJN92_09210 [Undibacterium parvum]
MKQKRYVAAGLPPAGNRTTTTEEHQTLNNSNQKHLKPSAHIPCASQAGMPEEAHGIWVMAGSVCKYRTAQAYSEIRAISCNADGAHGAPYANLAAELFLIYFDLHQ